MLEISCKDFKIMNWELLLKVETHTENGDILSPFSDKRNFERLFENDYELSELRKNINVYKIENGYKFRVNFGKV